MLAFGGGVNSTALLVGLVARGESVDAILFADTGGERPETYQHVRDMSAWCELNDLPPIVTVSLWISLEQDCLNRKTLPAIAFGFKTCSQRWKQRPQDNWMKDNPQAKEAWARGEKITKLIGFDADESHRIKDYQDDQYTVAYPLVDWGWSRDDCISAIRDSGVSVPPKSSCFFCPSMKPREIQELAGTNPDLLTRALAMETNATESRLAGLGRNYSWTQMLNFTGRQLDIFTPEAPCECMD